MARLRTIFLATPYLPLAVFVASRLVVLIACGSGISDVPFYLDTARRGLLDGGAAYRDFFFPYPPLSLPLVYLPLYYESWVGGYHLAFRLEMVVFDLLGLWLLARFAKKTLELPPVRVHLAIYAYSLLGLAVGHLIYDRIDLVIAAVFMGTMVVYRRVWLSQILNGVGIVVKVLPLFWVPISCLATQFKSWLHLFRRACWYILPALTVLIVYNHLTEGGLFENLLDQQRRGIQIESLWATPFWIKHLVAGQGSVPIDSRYNAHHLHPDVVGEVPLAIARYAGFVLLMFFYAYVFFKSLKKRRDFSPQLHFSCCFAVVLFFITTQRVLSPQFFIWVLPGFCVWWVTQGGIWNAVSIPVLYLLTFVGFSLGYWKLVGGEPFFVAVLVVRNLLLLAVTTVVVVKMFRALHAAGFNQER